MSGYYEGPHKRSYYRSKDAFFRTARAVAKTVRKGMIRRKGKHRNRSDRPYYMTRHTRTVNGITTINNPASGTTTSGAFVFKLQDLPNYTEFTALFDNYQMMCVVLKLTPVKNQMNTNLLGTVEIPKIGIAYDYDDGNPPTTMDALRQYATYREYDMTQPITLKIYPKVSIATYAGALTTGYLRPTPKLMKQFRFDCAYPNVEFFGIKFFIPDTAGTAGAFSYIVDAKYYIKMTGLI